MINVLDRIRRDHANLAKLLDAIERELDRFDRDELPDYDIIEGVVEYCLDYPDLYHHPLEDLIVRRLSELEPAAKPAIAGLEAEHQALAAATRRFAESLQGVLLDQEVTREEFQALAREFVARYRDHMRKEEETFLPVAAKLLNREALAEIEAQAKKREDPVFGADQSARFDTLRKKILHWSQGLS